MCTPRYIDFREKGPITVRGSHQGGGYCTPFFWGQTTGDLLTQKLEDGLLQNQIHSYI